MDVIKLMFVVVPQKKELSFYVIELDSGIRLEYCKGCVCDLLQILNLWM